MAVLMQAHKQWATRPDDERFTSLDELLEHARHQRQISQTGIVESRIIGARPVTDDDDRPIGLSIVGAHHEAVAPTHYAFGQLCSLAGAPAGYLRTLQPDLAADCLNASMLQRKPENVGVMTRFNGERTLAAATGPAYGRIWNADVIDALVRRFGDGRSGQFTVPGEFGREVPITKANTTLFASDRDMFVFLADERNRIEVPGRRPGEIGSLARGFFVWNSEVGNTTLGMATFLFDYVCANRIVWGADDVQEVRIRHTSGAPLRWLDEVVPAIQNYAEKSSHSITSAIADARARRFDEPEVEKVLTTRFTRNQAQAIKAAHLADEGRPIESAWDVVVGATAYARNIQHQDQRIAIERIAGKVLTEASR